MSWGDSERETSMQESSGRWKLWVFDALEYVVALLWSQRKRKVQQPPGLYGALALEL